MVEIGKTQTSSEWAFRLSLEKTSAGRGLSRSTRHISRRRGYQPGGLLPRRQLAIPCPDSCAGPLERATLLACPRRTGEEISRLLIEAGLALHLQSEFEQAVDPLTRRSPPFGSFDFGDNFRIQRERPRFSNCWSHKISHNNTINFAIITDSGGSGLVAGQRRQGPRAHSPF